MNEALTPAASVKNIKKAFGSGGARTQALDGVSFDVLQGEFVSIMGPSGCGKSTLLYIIGGLEARDEGEALVFGSDMSVMSDSQKSAFRRKNIGFVFQFYNLVQNLTVEENVLLPCIMGGERPSAHRERLDWLLELVGLFDRKKSVPRELSGGQQQRVSIARAIMASPGLILADEPTGNLDSASGAGIMELFSRLNSEQGVSIIQVTHSPEAARFTPRIIKMRDGRVTGD